MVGEARFQSGGYLAIPLWQDLGVEYDLESRRNSINIGLYTVLYGDWCVVARRKQQQSFAPESPS